MITTGSYVHKPMLKFLGGIPFYFIFLKQTFLKILMVLHKRHFTRAFIFFKPNWSICRHMKSWIYGSEFWTMYNWPFSDLEHFYYTWFAPSYSETISFGVVVKSTNRAFRKHILYIPLLIFVHHTGLQMQKKWQKVMFLHFFIFSEPSCKFSSYIGPSYYLPILSNYSVNLVCLGPVS